MIFNGVRVCGTQPVVDLETVWDQTVELLGWMAPGLAAIHAAHPAVPHLLAARP